MDTSMFTTVLSLIFLLNIRQHIEACRPGPSSKVSSHHPRVTTPLNLKQRVPDVSEQTLGASGEAEGPIERDSNRFNTDLVENTNSDIQFKDEEGTGADRLMTQRCKDKLNTLAISVMNRWPGVQLRVIEAWDEDGVYEANSLHYEGRAVQITTSDKDKTKYGRLARMAVEAGFDWVSYESRNFVHCSVHSGQSDAATKGGCFYKASKVTLSSGQIRSIQDLDVGDAVMVARSDGTISYSNVIMTMDNRPQQETLFRIICTGQSSISLTSEHLIYVSDTNSTFSSRRVVFAEEVRVGQYIYTYQHEDLHVTPRIVTAVSSARLVGAVAPLTEEGSIIVDGIAASSYAVIRDEWIAHLAFAPLRWANKLPSIRWQETAEDQDKEQYLHWYPKLLYKYGGNFVQSRLYEGFVLPD